MELTDQGDLLSGLSDMDFARMLLADMHDDLKGRVARFRQLNDLSSALGSLGSMLAGGEVAYAAWCEARSSFVHGNFVATVLLSQALAEQTLAAFLALGLDGETLPTRIGFRETLKRCRSRDLITERDAADLERLMEMRNPLSHHRLIDEPIAARDTS